MTAVQAVSTEIVKVELYRAQALVTRRGRFRASGPERSVLRVSGLPLALEDATLRARLPEPGGIHIQDLHLELDLGVRQGDRRTGGQQELLDLERRRAALSLEQAREAQRLQFLEALIPGSPDEAGLPERLAFEARPVIAPRLSLAAWVREESGPVRERLRALGNEIRELNDALAQARHRLRQESQAERERLRVIRKAARLVLQGGEPGREVGLELSYLVPAARWVPLYELRVSPERGSAELAVLALVAQRTGEDWPRAEMSLSTADLLRSSALPELESWRIGKAQPRKGTGWKELPDTLSELFDGYDRGLRAPAGPASPRPLSLPDMPPLLPAEGRKGKDAAPAALDVLGELRSARAQSAASGRAVPLGEPAPQAPPPPPCEAPAAEATSCSVELAEDGECADLVMASQEVCAKSMPMQLKAVSRPAAPMRAKARGRKAEREEATPPYPSSAAPMDRMMPQGPAARAFGAEGGAGGVFPGQAEITAEPVLVAAEDALTYGRLRMVGPEERAGRGNLRASGLSEGLAEQIGELAPGSAGELRRLAAGELLSLVGASRAHLQELPLPLHAVPVAQSAGHFAVRYPAESPVEIRADGQPHQLALLRREGAVRRVYRCVPSIDPQVYQVAVFENPLKVPLLAGPVKVYRDGDFVVDAPLQTTPPAKPITVNLGVEPGISVARNTHFEETTEGLLGGASALAHRVEITVHSKLAQPAEVEVFERIPVSDVDDLEVKLVSTQPAATSYDQRDRGALLRGGYRFTLSLAPREKKTCTLVYRIVLPSKQVLVGGNRRD